MHRSSLEVAATWLALGLDTDKAIFYRQSDIPEIPELTWILTSVTAKGLMNRAHAYKAAVQANEEAGSPDPDRGITMALVLLPDPHGRGHPHVQGEPRARGPGPEAARGDGARHRPALQSSLRRALRVARGRHRRQHGDPARARRAQDEQELRQHHSAVLAAGGSCASSSCASRPTRWSRACRRTRRARRCSTSTGPSRRRPKLEQMRRRYAEGAGWGQIKEELYEYLDAHLRGPRAEYERLMAAPDHVEAVLRQGRRAGPGAGGAVSRRNPPGGWHPAAGVAQRERCAQGVIGIFHGLRAAGRISLCRANRYIIGVF